MKKMMLLTLLAACSTDTFEGPPDGAALDGDVADSTDDHKVGFKPDADDAEAGADAPFDAAPATSKRVFITAARYLANLGGATGADAKCQAAATKASLSGSYMAWLSTPTSSPKTRFTPATVPYVLLDGTPIATDFQTMITAGALLHAIDRDETNKVVSYDATSAEGVAWTQTKWDGTYQTPGGCGSFTSTNPDDGLAGCDNATTSSWSICGDFGCALTGQQSAGLALYCFEQ